jgi:hypothetical protein
MRSRYVAEGVKKERGDEQKERDRHLSTHDASNMDEVGPYITHAAQQGAAANKVPTTPALNDAGGQARRHGNGSKEPRRMIDDGWSGAVRDGRHVPGAVRQTARDSKGAAPDNEDKAMNLGQCSCPVRPLVSFSSSSDRS